MLIPEQQSENSDQACLTAIQQKASEAREPAGLTGEFIAR
jgi:hypothetical protein